MTRKRCWEIIPGLLVWLTLILSVTLSFVRPLWMIYFIILFDLYWLLRILYFLPFLLTSWYRYRQALKRNWQAEVEVLPAYDRIRQVIFSQRAGSRWKLCEGRRSLRCEYLPSAVRDPCGRNDTVHPRTSLHTACPGIWKVVPYGRPFIPWICRKW